MQQSLAECLHFITSSPVRNNVETSWNMFK